MDDRSPRAPHPPRPPPARTGRLFVALWPDAAARAGLAAWQAAFGWPATARPTPAVDLHLTLVFIGSIEMARLADVQALPLEPPPPAELVLDTPERWRSGLVVLTTSRVPDALGAMQERLLSSLQQLGLTIDDDRPWRPHVTLARSAPATLPQRSPPPVAWALARPVLAMRDGPHYRQLLRP